MREEEEHFSQRKQPEQRSAMGGIMANVRNWKKLTYKESIEQ
jgi:hypothetical protein